VSLQVESLSTYHRLKGAPQQSERELPATATLAPKSCPLGRRRDFSILRAPMPFDPHAPPPPTVFSNNNPVIFRLFVAFWVIVVVPFAGTATSNANVSGPIIAFWALSLFLTAIALWAPIVRVEVSDIVLILEQAPVWRRVRRFAAKELTVSGIEENDDGEGGTSYSCSLVLPGGQKIMLASSTSRSEVAETRLRLINALRAAERKAR
jgi:hypothetical protein